jgi:ABC-2 type transport system permease protein
MNLPDQPGGFLWLLGFEAKIGLRAWTGDATKQVWTRVGVLGFTGLIALGCGYLAARGLAMVEPAQNLHTALVVGTSLVIAFFATLMMSQAILAVVNVMYTRGDLDLLLSSPVSPKSVAMARAVGVAVSVSLLYAVAIAAVLIWTPLTGAWRWLMLGPTLLSLALLMTALGMVVARFLLRLFGPRRTQVATQILTALLGAGFFIASQSFNFFNRNQSNAVATAFMDFAASVDVQPWNPLWWPARAFLGDLTAQLALIAIALGAFTLAARAFAQDLPANAAAIAAVNKAGTNSKKTTKPMQPGLVAGFMRKEWRLLRRDPLLISQVGMQMLYLLPLLISLVAATVNGGNDAVVANYMFASAFVFLASTLAGSLTWITASAEDAQELILAAPVRRRDVELGKLLAATVPVVALMIAPAIFVGMTTPHHAAIVLAGATGAAVSASLIGIWYQRPGNRREFRRQRPSSWVAAIGQIVVAIGWASTVGMAMSPLGWWALVPLVFTLGGLLVLEDSRPKTTHLA